MVEGWHAVTYTCGKREWGGRGEEVPLCARCCFLDLNSNLKKVKKKGKLKDPLLSVQTDLDLGPTGAKTTTYKKASCDLI